MPTLEQIQAKLKKLQAQADVMIARKAQAAVDQIRELMLKHGLTTADIEAEAKARRAARGAGNGRVKAAGAAKAGKTATPAKYLDPKTGATWTGHGRAPGWIVNAKDRTAFLISGASEMKAAAPAKGGKGQPKGAQPPKYRDPKTGATWSGRGPAPAWLASVKDRSKFLIEGAAAAAPKAAAKTGKAKSAAVSKKAAAKKAGAARKTVAKKAAAKKAPTASRKAAVKKAAAKKAPARKVATKAAAAPSAAAPQAATAEASA
ncbi:H-NS histone family protein [Paraburkholderia sp. Ac-20342]|uniref:H-NS family nucleoid-associated regulatory protein n=1 Tax=unclassified Paraburkholderia TaxID=2615204 RepID=UPI001422438D|nr:MULTISPECIES: H-NS family nucleoid-associated regulatory protein [unclassified Paraburkholderia]MBN3851056.1 H-NS histone family protein [Paraburkholderia sp. Ac-20342]NIF77537.1 H-NS histone family protein [Paraburkholderia sp. Cy-641]